jgi:phage shock protein A
VFGAFGRYLRAFWYLVTGRIDAARKELSKNPYVIQATFDSIISEKTKRIHHYKDAVAAMIAQEEKKISTIKKLTEEVNRLQSLKEGAAAKARTLASDLKARGKSLEEIKKSEEYQKCLSAFNDFSSTLEEKTRHIAELEDDVKQLGQNLGNHKVQLQQLQREIGKLKEEAAATVADVITAKEEESIANMLAGISEDRTGKELQEMRELREGQKAKARVSRELAGTDTKRQEAEFIDYARTHASTDEFDRLIGLAEASDAAGREAEPEAEPRLPER